MLWDITYVSDTQNIKGVLYNHVGTSWILITAMPWHRHWPQHFLPFYPRARYWRICTSGSFFRHLIHEHCYGFVCREHSAGVRTVSVALANGQEDVPYHAYPYAVPYAWVCVCVWGHFDLSVRLCAPQDLSGRS